MSGMQWYTPYSKGEVFRHLFPKNLEALTRKMAATGAKIVFFSGDIHFTEVSRVPATNLGYETREITSSAMHSDSIPILHWALKNPERLNVTSFFNFVTIDTNLDETALHMDIKAFSSWRTPLFKTAFALEL
jgi:hypothetical protein